MASENQVLSFTAFLSHRYKSPEVNLYFFNLFEDIAQIQFEVDEGSFATSVTRLERMIRAADAFIGIYPFPGSWESAQSLEELKKTSRYFRLELDLAIRSHKPAIVFYDESYGNILKCPDNVLSIPFNLREITGAGRVPRAIMYRDKFKKFCEIVTTWMNYSVSQTNRARTTIGIILPPENSNAGYTSEDIQTIATTLEKYGYDDQTILRWPPILARDSFVLFQEADWMIVDIGDEMAMTGIPAYLHGQFIPMMRLKHILPGTAAIAQSPLEKVLFGGVEVGYSKDILAWEDKISLVTGLEERLLSFKAGIKRITTKSEAELYFRSAALRKQVVFLSYSGEDREIAANISGELKKYFQQVFDYRDGKSIRPGQPWLEEIFKQLSLSAIGIPLLSNDYFASGNCKHEAQEMVVYRDNGKMQIIPIKLYALPFDTPSWLQNIQYLRFPDYSCVEEVVREILQLVE